MNSLDELSSVGRELFFKNILTSGVAIYFMAGKNLPENLDKGLSSTIMPGQILLDRGKFFFRGNTVIDSAAKNRSGARLFFFVDSVGYFCDLDLSIGASGPQSPVPQRIMKVEQEVRGRSLVLSAKLLYRSENSTVEIGVEVPESFDVLNVMDARVLPPEIRSRLDGQGKEKYPFMPNIYRYLCGENGFESSIPSRRPLDLLYLDKNYVALGDSCSHYPFVPGQRYSVFLDFKLSPIIRRKVEIGCVIRDVESMGRKKCFVCGVDTCREEDSRFLSEGLSRFL